MSRCALILAVALTVSQAWASDPGASAASLGALDGDGVGDLAVGTLLDDDGRSDRGAVCPPTLFLRLNNQVNEAFLFWTGDSDLMYDIVRGDLVILQNSGGDFSQATIECLANDFPGESPPEGLSYTLLPGHGEGFWFLIRPVTNASDSYDTCAGFQVEGRDAEITASGVDCP